MKSIPVYFLALVQLVAFGALAGFIAAAIQEWWRNR